MPGDVKPAGNASTRITALSAAAWAYAGHIYQLVVGFGLTFYVVRHLPVTEYGLLAFLTALSANLYLLDLGISNVLVQEYVAASVNSGKERLNDLLNTTFVALAGLGFLGVLILVGLSRLLPGPFNIPAQSLHEASLVLVVAALAMQIALPAIALEHIYQSAHRFDRINQFKFVGATLQLVLTLGVLATGHGIVALALVQLVVAAVQMSLLVLAMPSSVPGAGLTLGHFRLQLLRRLYSQSKWAFLQNISISLFDLLSWTFLGSLGSMSQAAVYALAAKLPRQLWTLVANGTTVLLPHLSRHSAEGNIARLRKIFLAEQTLIIGGVLPFVLLGIAFARPLITILAGSHYLDAALVMRWLLVAFLAQCVSFPSDELLYATGQVRQCSLYSLAAGIASVTAAFFLIPRYGAAGLAAALACSQLIIGCSLFLTAGARAARMRWSDIVRAALRGLALPTCVLAAATAVVMIASRHLAPSAIILAATSCGCVYFVLWGRHTALPLYHKRGEVES